MTTPPTPDAPLTPPGPPVFAPASGPGWGEPADRLVEQAVPGPSGEPAQPRRGFLPDLLLSASVVGVWFGLLGMLGALVWVKVTPLPVFTRIAETGTMDEEQLAKQFSTNGWFLVIALIAGLISGVVLLLVRTSTHPAIMVVLVGLGGAAATLVMVRCGLSWGPGDPNAVLAVAEIGDVVPVQLKPDARGIYFAWSVAALLGASIALGFSESRDRDSQSVEAEALQP